MSTEVTAAVDPIAACPNDVLAWASMNAASCGPSCTRASRRGIGALPLKTVFQLAVIAATAAGPLTGSAAAVVLAVVLGLADCAAWLPPPQAARIRHPVAAGTAHARRSSGQCRQRMVAVCHTKGRICTDTASGLPGGPMRGPLRRLSPVSAATAEEGVLATAGAD